MEPIKAYKFKDGSTLEVHYDENPLHPREDYDNLSKMVCFHRRYVLGDKHRYRKEHFNSWEELKEQIEEDSPNCLIRPLYLYDHSGISISTTPFNCPWDSGQIGFAYVTKEDIDNEYDGDVKRAEELLEVEVNEYDKYISGDCLRFVLRNPPCCECGGPGKINDSCGSFHSEEEMIDHLEEPHKTELQEMLK